MARKNKSKSKKETASSFTYPSLHQDVQDSVSDKIASVWFNSRGNSGAPETEYHTHVMGKFECVRAGCSNARWTSKMVAILIRRYPGNGYYAVVYNQRCKSCGALGAFTLDKDSYVSRVSYRVKKWAGVEMEQPHYVKKEGPPHRSELCEGCKHGHCHQMESWEG